MSDQEKLIYDLAGPAAIPPTPWSYWVVEDRLLAGAYLGSPDPDERRNKIQSLLDAGVHTFINLMEEDETNYQGQPFEPYDDPARGLCPDARCLRFATKDLSVPSKDLMIQILKEIDRSTTDHVAIPVDSGNPAELSRIQLDRRCLTWRILCTSLLSTVRGQI